MLTREVTKKEDLILNPPRPKVLCKLLITFFPA